MKEYKKPLVWLGEEVKTPPFSLVGRIEAGRLLSRLQKGEKLTMPFSRPMPAIGSRCHELRIRDINKSWRIIYRIDKDAILILEVFEKKTNLTPSFAIKNSKKRISFYERSLR